MKPKAKRSLALCIHDQQIRRQQAIDGLHKRRPIGRQFHRHDKRPEMLS